MSRTVIRTAVGAAAAALALTPLGYASADPEQSASVDLNGDGIVDTATLSKSGPDTQLLQATVNGHLTAAIVPGDGRADIAPLRVTDVNRDGKGELVVTEFVGANTLTFSVWDFANGSLRALTTPDGNPLKLYEGGGASAHNGYECAVGPVLITLGTTSDNGTTYSGERVAYDVTNGVATETDTYPINGVPIDHPVMTVDPATCE